MSSIRLLLVDDQSMFWEGLRKVLSLHADFMIVGEAANGQELVQGVQRLRPDVVLMDLRMPHLAGVQATPITGDANPFHGQHGRFLDKNALCFDGHVEKARTPEPG